MDIAAKFEFRHSATTKLYSTLTLSEVAGAKHATNNATWLVTSVNLHIGHHA